ncbi:MAG: hypothetical protein Q9195_006276 [Heterodermia aff. obscurata]
MPFIENVVEELGTSKFGAGYSLDEATLKPNLYRQRNNDSEILLVVSPYTDEAHLLDLSTIEPAQALLAKALTWMVPIRDDYATACYTESFNWIEVMHALKTLVAAADFHWRTRTFFIVIFRSQVKAATDYSHLGELDRRSHIEAMKSGGLLKYWFGTPDADGRNLATCTKRPWFPYRTDD